MSDKKFVVAVGVSAFALGYHLGKKSAYGQFASVGKLWPQMEAAFTVHEKAITGRYKDLSDADRKLAIYEDYQFELLARKNEFAEIYKRLRSPKVGTESD